MRNRKPDNDESKRDVRKKNTHQFAALFICTSLTSSWEMVKPLHEIENVCVCVCARWSPRVSENSKKLKRNKTKIKNLSSTIELSNTDQFAALVIRTSLTSSWEMVKPLHEIENVCVCARWSPWVSENSKKLKRSKPKIKNLSSAIELMNTHQFATLFIRTSLTSSCEMVKPLHEIENVCVCVCARWSPRVSENSKKLKRNKTKIKTLSSANELMNTRASR